MVAVLRPDAEVRPMRKGDIEAVSAIERRSYPYPWNKGIFADCLRIGYCCRVVELDGQTRGYAILSAAAGEAHLLNLCVDADYRRSSLGQLLLDGVLVEAALCGAARLFLEVRPSNAAAIELYRQAGFRVIGRRPGYYPAPSGREDALVMVRHIEPSDG